MEIIGRGLLATALAPFVDHHPDTLVFASGVSDSGSTDPAAYLRERTLLEQSIRDAIAAGQRVVYFSSAGAVYGRWTGHANEASPQRPRTVYGAHKVACEQEIIASGVRHVILRLPNVVGDSGNAHQLVPSLVAQVLFGHVRVYTAAARDLVDAQDLGRTADAILSLNLGTQSVVVNVASGRAIAAMDIVRAICRIVGASPVIEPVDAGHAEHLDVSRLRLLLGRDPFAGEDYAIEVLERHVPRLLGKLGASSTIGPDGVGTKP